MMVASFVFSAVLLCPANLALLQVKEPDLGLAKVVMSGDKYYATMHFEPPRKESGNIDIWVATAGRKTSLTRYRPPLIVAGNPTNKMSIRWSISNGYYWILEVFAVPPGSGLFQ